MTTPPGLLTRLRTAEAELAALRSELARYASRSAVPPRAEPIVRLAVTCPTAADDYPAAAGCFPASVFPIKFLDVDFTETAGDQALTDTVRSGAAQAVAYSLHDRYLAEGTPVRVLRANRRWVILDGEAVALIGTTDPQDETEPDPGELVDTPLNVSTGFANDTEENYFEWDAANARLEVQRRGAGLWRFSIETLFKIAHPDKPSAQVIPLVYNTDLEITLIEPNPFPALLATTSAAAVAWGPNTTYNQHVITGTFAAMRGEWSYLFSEGDWIKFLGRHFSQDADEAIDWGTGSIMAIRSTYNDWLP